MCCPIATNFKISNNCNEATLILGYIGTFAVHSCIARIRYTKIFLFLEKLKNKVG